MMGLRERFEEISGWATAEHWTEEVRIQKQLQAVCADRIERGGDHDWPQKRLDYVKKTIDDGQIGTAIIPVLLISGPCKICGKEEP